jgi:hypothetical protein
MRSGRQLIAIYGDEPARAGARPAKRRRDGVDDPLLISDELAATASQLEGCGELIARLRQAPLLGSDYPRAGRCASRREPPAAQPNARRPTGSKRASTDGRQHRRKREKQSMPSDDSVHCAVSMTLSTCQMQDIGLSLGDS